MTLISLPPGAWIKSGLAVLCMTGLRFVEVTFVQAKGQTEIQKVRCIWQLAWRLLFSARDSCFKWGNAFVSCWNWGVQGEMTSMPRWPDRAFAPTPWWILRPASVCTRLANTMISLHHCCWSAATASGWNGAHLLQTNPFCFRQVSL